MRLSLYLGSRHRKIKQKLSKSPQALSHFLQVLCAHFPLPFIAPSGISAASPLWPPGDPDINSQASLTGSSSCFSREPFSLFLRLTTPPDNIYTRDFGHKPCNRNPYFYPLFLLKILSSQICPFIEDNSLLNTLYAHYTLSFQPHSAVTQICGDVWLFVVVVLVAQSCPTLCDSVGSSPPGSSIPGILQARMLGWVAIPFSKGSSWPRNQPRLLLLYLGRWFQYLILPV